MQNLYLNFRAAAIDGGIVEPYLLEGDGSQPQPALRALQWHELPPLFAGKNVLFCSHGFNVNYAEGARALGRLGNHLALPEPNLFIGILWPGDAWLPVVNYPFEGNDANRCGRLLADFCDRWLATAQSISFASHSLGARLILSAAQRMSRRLHLLCLTAAAVDRDVLEAEFKWAAANAERIVVLASRDDQVLKLAFRVGDPLSDLLQGESITARPALGYGGPSAGSAHLVERPWQIRSGYGHGDYLPPSGPQPSPTATAWQRVAEFIERAFYDQPRDWPR